MRLFEKIKKFFELPEQCSTCRYWEPLYNKFGICKRYDSPYCQPLKKMIIYVSFMKGGINES